MNWVGEEGTRHPEEELSKEARTGENKAFNSGGVI